MTSSDDPRRLGVGRILIAVYGILALAALGRSGLQLATRFGEAPLAYSLSALAAVVYVVATVALVSPGRRWRAVAWAVVSFEAVGVLVIGTVSIVRPELFPDATVWSQYGSGYLFIPLVLPVLGLWWLWSRRDVVEAS